MIKGIDVSYAQGIIDWHKVSQTVDFAIIRATATYPHNGKKGIDLQWERNIKEAKKYKIPVGAYHYSYALTVEEAIKEADHFLNTIKGYTFEYPVIFDFEDASQSKLSSEQMVNICLAWLERVEQAGYYVMLYSMASWLKYPLNNLKLAKYDKWVAHVNVDKPMVEGGIWQYSWTGKVDGVVGDVDMNIAYTDYPTIIKNAKLNGFNKNETIEEEVDIDYKQKYEKELEHSERLTKQIKQLENEIDKIKSDIQNILDNN